MLRACNFKTNRLVLFTCFRTVLIPQLFSELLAMLMSAFSLLSALLWAASLLGLLGLGTLADEGLVDVWDHTA